MILLTATTQKVQLITSAAATIDVYACGVDKANGANLTTEFATYTPITTATTTDIVAAPAATTTRNVKTIHIRNRHASQSCDVTVMIDVSGTDYELVKYVLRAGEMMQYVEGDGFRIVTRSAITALTTSTADQTASAADTYLTGSVVNPTALRPLAIGTRITWRMVATKTAAGVATPIFSVRFGTGVIGDTARLTFTGVAQTAVVDTADIEIQMVVRSVGGAGVVAGCLELHHHLAATGFANLAHNIIQATSAGFDTTTVTGIGVSVNPGSAGVWTFQIVTAEVENL